MQVDGSIFSHESLIEALKLRIRYFEQLNAEVVEMELARLREMYEQLVNG